MICTTDIQRTGRSRGEEEEDQEGSGAKTKKRRRGDDDSGKKKKEEKRRRREDEWSPGRDYAVDLMKLGKELESKKERNNKKDIMRRKREAEILEENERMGKEIVQLKKEKGEMEETWKKEKAEMEETWKKEEVEIRKGMLEFMGRPDGVARQHVVDCDMEETLEKQKLKLEAKLKRTLEKYDIIRREWTEEFNRNEELAVKNDELADKVQELRMANESHEARIRDMVCPEIYADPVDIERLERMDAIEAGPPGPAIFAHRFPPASQHWKCKERHDELEAKWRLREKELMDEVAKLTREMDEVCKNSNNSNRQVAAVGDDDDGGMGEKRVLLTAEADVDDDGFGTSAATATDTAAVGMATTTAGAMMMMEEGCCDDDDDDTTVKMFEALQARLQGMAAERDDLQAKLLQENGNNESLSAKVVSLQNDLNNVASEMKKSRDSHSLALEREREMSVKMQRDFACNNEHYQNLLGCILGANRTLCEGLQAVGYPTNNGNNGNNNAAAMVAVPHYHGESRGGRGGLQ